MIYSDMTEAGPCCQNEAAVMNVLNLMRCSTQSKGITKGLFSNSTKKLELEQNRYLGEYSSLSSQEMK